jgi:hypothetical protein
MKVMYNGRVLKNVNKKYASIVDQIPDLCLFLETTRVLPDEELKFNHALLLYRWEGFLEDMEVEDPLAFNYLKGHVAQSYFAVDKKFDERRYMVVTDKGTRVVTGTRKFKGVNVCGTLFQN